MIVIVDHATLKDEEGNKETIVKTAAIQQDIKELLRCVTNGGLLYGF